MTIEPQHAVLAPQDAPVYDHLNMLTRIVLDGRDTGGVFSIVEERAAFGAMTPKHVHQRESETFIVLEGALEVWHEGRSTFVEAGSMMFLPMGREHAFRVAAQTAHYYNLITRAGFERLFSEFGTLTSSPFHGTLPTPGPPSADDMTRLEGILEALGCSITGPPPFPTIDGLATPSVPVAEVQR